MKHFIGVDIAKETHYATIISENNVIVEKAFPFTNDKEGFDLFLSKFKSLPKDSILIGFESTAHYHQNLYSFLSELDYKCELINPIVSKRFRGLNIRNTKTDKVDALCLAQLLLFQYSESSGTKFNCVDLKIYCDERERLKSNKSTLYIQLTAELDKVFPELKKFLNGNLKSKLAHNLLKCYSTAQEIKEVRVDKLENIVSQNSKGVTRKRIEDLKELSKNSVGFNSTAISLRIKNLIYQIELLEQQLSNIEAEIINIMQEMDSAILNIPGMGYIQAAYIIAVINNISRFDNQCKLLAYAGLDPIVRQSGKFTAQNTRMSKRGNKMLRYALIWSAHNLCRNSKTLDTYYKLKRSQGKSHYNALGHCAKKLVNYIYYVLNNTDKTFVLD